MDSNGTGRMEELHAGTTIADLLVLYPSEGHTCDRDAYIVRVTDVDILWHMFRNDVRLTNNDDGTALIESQDHSLTAQCWKIRNGKKSALDNLTRIREGCL